MSSKSFSIVRGQDLANNGVVFPCNDVKRWGWANFPELATTLQMDITALAKWAGPLSHNFSGVREDTDPVLQFAFIDGNDKFHQPYETLTWAEGIVWVPAGFAQAIEKAFRLGVETWDIENWTVEDYRQSWTFDPEVPADELDPNIWNEATYQSGWVFVVRGKGINGNFVKA